MKIGICAYPLSRGKETGRGLERVVDEFCSYLTQEKVEYDFYDSGIIRSEMKAVMISIKYIFSLMGKKNDVYFATYPVAGLFPALLRKRPLVTAVHDMIPFNVHEFDSKLKYSIKRWCIKYSCIKSKHIIVPFESTKRQIMDLFKISSDRISVIPYGVNHQVYYVDKKIQKVKNRVAFLGEAKRSKGMDSIINAFKYVREKVPDAELILASNGSELELMKKLAMEILPAGSYQFVGFIPEDKMREFYSTAQILVFPSRYGFGLSSIEAMACGTPAIVGATLDALDFFTDQDLLVNPDDYLDLAKKIQNLLLQNEKYEEKSESGIRIAESFSWGNMSKSYTEECFKAIKSYSQGN